MFVFCLFCQPISDQSSICMPPEKKYQKTSGFLMFLEVMEMDYWPEMRFNVLTHLKPVSISFLYPLKRLGNMIL